MIGRLAILGANSDVVSRFVVPALIHLWAIGDLPEGLQVVAVARQDWDVAEYRHHLDEQLDAHAPGLDPDARAEVLERIRYQRADVTDADELGPAIGENREPVVVYLALPPAVFPAAVEALTTTGLPSGSRLVVEKPFGEDLGEARRLNAMVLGLLPEDHVHRVDHFLGLRTVHDLLGLRFGNRIFEPVWNCHHIERIDIVWDETLTLEGRAGYYDETGALRDMLQNHLLQLLALVAMEPPITLDEQDLRDRKAQLLREVTIPDVETAAARSLRARYTAGSIGDRDVPAYLDEEGVDPGSGTETFAEMTLTVDNWRWSGVPFRLRSGKALGADVHEIVVRFRDIPHHAFGGADRATTAAPANELRITFEPDRMALRINVTGTAAPFTLEAVELAHEPEEAPVPAYGVVLRAILLGDPTLSIRGDEAECSWAIVEPFLDAWEQGRVELGTYPAGSSGP